MNEINREIRAVEIHQKAQSYYQISEEFGYKFLMELQIIKKEDLYLDLGFQKFGEYTENNFG